MQHFHLDRFVWQHAAQSSLLFRFVAISVPLILVQCIAINIGFYHHF